MNKRQNNSARASALQVSVAIVLVAIVTILSTTSFSGAPKAAAGPPPPELTVSLPIDTLDNQVPIDTVFLKPVMTTNIDAGLNYIGFQGDFRFDETVINFSPPFVEPAGLTAEDWSITAITFLEGPPGIRTLRVSALRTGGATPLNGSGVLFNLKMRRVSSEPGRSTLLRWGPPDDRFFFYDNNLGATEPNQPDGFIAITGPGPTATPTPSPTPGPIFVCGTFTNPTAINIPASGSGGISAPYPSSIVIQGIGGGIAKVTVAINGITHPDANDIDVLLVGPDGRNAIIMSDVGTYDSVTGVNLVLDDAAAAALPVAALLTSGTFRPTNIQLCYDEIGPLDAFPAPAPSPSGASTFSIFNGTNPNGTWNLYVFDDNQNGGVGGSGSFSGGWTITISTDSCVGPTATPMPSPAPGAATHFSFEVLSNVFGWITFRLTALDELNNIATAYPGTVHFTSFPPWSSLPPDSGLTNGVGTFNAGLIGPDTYTIIATDTNSASITVTSECIPAQKPPTPSPTPTPPPTPTPGPTGTPLPTPCGVTFAENFDSVTAPSLPTGWTTASTGGLTWRTSTANSVSAPNNAWAFQYSQDGENLLETPLIAVPDSGGVPSFRNHFNLNFGGNGMVLEISVNGGAYDDIIAAGGVFLDGGYTLTIVCCFGNPLTGRMAWSGISGANADTYITTTIMLPATASGQNIRLKWRVGTAESFHFGEVRIDDIVLTPAGCPTPTPSPTATETPSPTPAGPTRALDLATRLHVETGNKVGIGGFIITGSAPRQILLRGIGPSLGGFGVPNPLADPVLELHGPFVTITNNNWRDTQQTEIEGTGIPPTNDLESAILVTLDPGAYTATLSGNSNGTGVGLVEIYDLSQGAASMLANISTRALVGTGSDIVIAGFILGGGSSEAVILLRGIGPSLATFGVPNALANPTLELRNGEGALVGSNDDYQDGPAVSLPPSDPLESALEATLSPGAYTALLSGVGGGTGVGLVEVYDLGLPAPAPTPSPTPTPSGTPIVPPPPPTPTPVTCIEHFDKVVAPALPKGWIASNPIPGDGVSWTTSTVDPGSAPNDAFIPDQDGISDKALDWTGIMVNSATARLTFLNNFDTEFSNGKFCDGGVLEISAPSISNGDFLDFTDSRVGAKCVAGCYTAERNCGDAPGPIGKPSMWAGSSGGYIDTIINLGPNLVGQTITLRWRFRSDEAVTAPGWRIDGVYISEAFCP